MILSIYAVESEPIVATKAIREALRVLDEATPASRRLGRRPMLADAKEILDTFHEDGVAILGETDDEDGAAELILALRTNGVYATTGSPERAARNHEAERMRRSGATPEEQIAALAPGSAPETPSDASPQGDPQIRPDAGAASALALCVMANGNPLIAAAHAATLARAQGEASIPMWRVVQQNLIATFPFIKDTLHRDGVLL